MSKRHWPILLAVVAVCTVFAYLNALGIYLSSNRGTPWGYTLFFELTNWYLYILLAPFVIRLCHRFRIDRENLTKTIIAHVPIALLFTIAHSVLLTVITNVPVYGTRELLRFVKSGYPVLIFDFLFSVVVYVMILSLTHAMDYYKQYREEELTASELKAQLAQSQLQALKMQLHPHFLFNTLNSISALQMEDTDAAQKMTARLGDFLRLTLDNVGSQKVTLKQEMEFLSCYLDIERVRFGRRLTVNVNIEPDALDVSVPNLILQPIAENAIKHGIASQIAPGRIDISARVSDHSLKIEVSDNGPGLRNNGTDPREGMGLTNTRERLERLYGRDYKFEMDNGAEGGLSVKLQIPIQTGIAGC
ncbi:MAG TPA: histidine kinase [Blastocatellia bacterium]|nr:histidine kinase [Blastocatellia bacterium]